MSSVSHLVGLLVSVIALIISIASFWSAANVSRDVGFTDAIKIQYGVYSDLSKLQIEHPLMSHLFAPTAERYDKSVELVGQSVMPLSDAARSSRLLEEGAIANQLFTTFEEIFELWKQAKTIDDNSRAKVYAENLEFFRGVLCNPRLLWYWDPDKGMRMSFDFSAEMRRYYKAKVTECVVQADPIGPFATPQATRQSAAE
jgi:hypothetical protein